MSNLLHTRIKIQWLIVICGTLNPVPLLLLHILAFSQSAPDPDTHLHVYLPPEGGQGTYLFSLISSNLILQRENTQNRRRVCKQWFQVSSSYDVMCLLFPIISQKYLIYHTTIMLMNSLSEAQGGRKLEFSTFAEI